jgi:hypothetical protein
MERSCHQSLTCWKGKVTAVMNWGAWTRLFRTSGLSVIALNRAFGETPKAADETSAIPDQSPGAATETDVLEPAKADQFALLLVPQPIG